MAPRFNAVIFDLDGTLMDTSEGILAAVRYTIDFFGFTPLSDSQIYHCIGPPIQNSFAHIFGLDGPILQEIATVFRSRYKDMELLKAKPYEGIFDLFQSLIDAGIKPAIATYKREDYAVKLLKAYGFNHYTDIMYGGDHENKLKKSDIIMKVLRDVPTTNLSEVVMVGDSDNDAIGAADMGLSFIGVTYGFGFKTKEDVFAFNNIGAADTIEELKEILLCS